MLLRTDFIENCDKWTAQPLTEGTWLTCMIEKYGMSFCTIAANLLLLNCSQYRLVSAEHLSYSVGSIYLDVLASINAIQTRKYPFGWYYSRPKGT